MTHPDIEAVRLARQIASDLFTDGSGQRTRRLVFDYHDDMKGTGWCEQAVADRIAAALHEQHAALAERLRAALVLLQYAEPPSHWTMEPRMKWRAERNAALGLTEAALPAAREREQEPRP